MGNPLIKLCHREHSTPRTPNLSLGHFCSLNYHVPLTPFLVYSTIMTTGSTLSILCDVFSPCSQAKPHHSMMCGLHSLQKGDFYRQGISTIIQEPITILHSLIEVHVVRLLHAIQKGDVISCFFQNTYLQVFPGKRAASWKSS